MLPLFRYFFYLAFNWNIKIAWIITLQEIRGERKYRIHTTGADELKKLDRMGIDTSHATIYMPVSYQMLEEAIAQLNPLRPIHHFLDIGCGKGRALCVAAHYGILKLTGIDLSKELCADAKMNLEQTRLNLPSINYSIINNDAFYYIIPADVDCIFLFNPFDELIMSGVVKNIMESFKACPRNITIAYVNPLHKALFIQQGFKEIYYSKRMKYMELSVLGLSTF